MINQPTQSSEMIDDAYENLRTHNCWTKYICKAVAYSAIKSTDRLINDKYITRDTGIYAEHLNNVGDLVGTVPTCVDPEDLEFPIDDGKLSYINSCGNSTKDKTPIKKLETTMQLYDNCMLYVERKNKIAEGKVISEIKRESAKQKSVSIQEKMASIIQKMHSMESNMTYIGKGLRQVDVEVKCIIKECQ